MTMTARNVGFIPSGLAYLVYFEKPKDESSTMGKYTVSTKADPRERPLEGEVVAVGDGMVKVHYKFFDTDPATPSAFIDAYQYQRGCKYKVGDRVVFGRYAGLPHIIGDTEFVILREEEIAGQMVQTPFDEPTE